MIICGVDRTGSHLWKTDPSGGYVAYNATAIGTGSEQVIELFEKKYSLDISFDDSIKLAMESIFLINDKSNVSENVKISTIDSKNKTMHVLTHEELLSYSKKVKK